MHLDQSAKAQLATEMGHQINFNATPIISNNKFFFLYFMREAIEIIAEKHPENIHRKRRFYIWFSVLLKDFYKEEVIYGRGWIL